jgi:hypothetical protein
LENKSLSQVKEFHSGISGACVGLVYAACTGRAKSSTSFYMASNWTIAAIPFFTVRQSIFSYLQHSRGQEKRTLYQKDKDALVSSVLSGTTLGFGAGYFWGMIK